MAFLIWPIAIESFPRMWDQHGVEKKNDIYLRIIPTYVGSTFFRRDIALNAANHSHVCGINSVYLEFVRLRLESFPHMWDQRGRPGKAVRSRRIIPTYVGSTKILSSSLSLFSNHSHVCGINGTT